MHDMLRSALLYVSAAYKEESPSLSDMAEQLFLVFSSPSEVTNIHRAAAIFVVQHAAFEMSDPDDPVFYPISEKIFRCIDEIMREMKL